MQKLYRLPCVLLNYAELEDMAINYSTLAFSCYYTDDARNLASHQTFFLSKNMTSSGITFVNDDSFVWNICKAKEYRVYT